jgi:hypothetical protein
MVRWDCWYMFYTTWQDSYCCTQRQDPVWDTLGTHCSAHQYANVRLLSVAILLPLEDMTTVHLHRRATIRLVPIDRFGGGRSTVPLAAAPFHSQKQWGRAVLHWKRHRCPCDGYPNWLCCKWNGVGLPCICLLE